MDTVTYQSYPLGQGALPPAIELARRLVDNRCHQESYQEAARARQRHLYAAACGDTPQSFTARFLSSLVSIELCEYVSHLCPLQKKKDAHGTYSCTESPR